MQVTETSADGLKREFRVVVPAGELEEKVSTRLGEIGRTVILPGFRPGRVPIQILRSRFGSSVLGEVLQSTVQGTSVEAIREQNLRPALPPKVDIVSFSEGSDLEYNMSLEILPEIPAPAFADLHLERLMVEVPGEEVDRAIGRIAEQQRKSEAVDRGAEAGDIIVVDVEGRVGDREIPGASGKGREIWLGSGGFIPGFEDQLIGAVAGEHRTVRVTFPEDYGVADFAGQEAVFTVEVKEVRQRQPAVIDDELGKAVGLESLAELRQEVQQQLQRDYDAVSRMRLKRVLLDRLAESYDFPVPPGMVDLEFENIWKQYQAEREASHAAPSQTADPQAGQADGTEPAAEGTVAEAASDATPAQPGGAAGEAAQSAALASERPPTADEDDEARRADYRRIAERRVRLGLLLAEVGRNNNITVLQDELNQAIAREARRHPGYEREVLEFYRQDPDAVATLRAPIFEDKVIDFITELAKIEDRKVTPQELMSAADDAEETHAAPGTAGDT